MSFSNPSLRNPSSRFFKWAGGEAKGGKVLYYDKEKGIEIEEPMPFQFVVLDELNTISGFSDADKSSYWSNEARDIRNAIFTVRTQRGIVAKGRYEELSNIKAAGAKYAKSVYVAYKGDDGKLAIGNFRIMGAALRAWIEFQKKFDTTKWGVIVKEAKGPLTKGATKYYIPVFHAFKLDANAVEGAKNLDYQLQKYLSSYLTSSVAIEDVPGAVDLAADDEEDLGDIHNIKGIDDQGNGYDSTATEPGITNKDIEELPFL